MTIVLLVFACLIISLVIKCLAYIIGIGFAFIVNKVFYWESDNIPKAFLILGLIIVIALSILAIVYFDNNIKTAATINLSLELGNLIRMKIKSVS